MHSLFSRSRTNSTPKKPQVDEFGAYSSPSKKSKKKQPNLPPPEPQLPDNSFLPTHLDRPRDELGGLVPPKDYDYGYLSYERHVVLGIEDVARLVEVVAHELITRGGITTPFIFSSLALDVSSSSIKRLIKLFLETCRPGVAMDKADKRWREEARFAGPHDLGMCFRWGLARVVRIQAGQEVRGLLPWDMYRHFKDSEAALEYPPTHFSTILVDLIPPLRSVFLTTFSLLTRLTANSASSGHTPPTLSTLFGPLFFGLGSQLRHQTFQDSYSQYLEAANATEHLILSFIRWQDVPVTGRPGTANSTADLGREFQLQEFASSAASASLGVPTRLKEWIKGYPAMLNNISYSSSRNGRPQARRGARTVRILSVRRNVRTYSVDLVKSGANWGYVPPSARLNPNVTNALASSKEWQRITPPGMKLQPRYSESYKKRMDIPAHVVPDFGPGAPSVASSPTSISTTPSFASTLTTTSIDSGAPSLSLSREGEDRFRSLTDLKWGEFENLGFGGLGTDTAAEKQLQFDLTESARMTRSEKRATLSWTDFSNAGFSRTDEPLSATLQFSTPLASSVTSWSVRDAELSKKLRKAQQQNNKGMPAFDWDVEPILGGEEVVEEGFVDVFCDLLCGSGWLDYELERANIDIFGPNGPANSKEADLGLMDRECNWALVELKSMAQSSRSPASEPLAASLSGSTSSTSSASDPRSGSTLILFEEFIPAEYRQKLRAALGSSSRRRLPSLFSSSQSTLSSSTKNKQWKSAGSTANVRGYGTVPLTPSRRDVEFDSMLRGSTVTKVISLSGTERTPTMGNPLPVSSTDRSATPNARGPSPQLRMDGARDGESPPPPPPASAKKSRFKFPTGLPVSPHPQRRPAEYSSVDFETRLASYSDEEHNGGSSPVADEAEKQKRRQSRDDAWVDILVATHNRRMGGQDAEMRVGNGERRRHITADPELASLEVAQVLASVQQERSMSPLSDDDFERRLGFQDGLRPQPGAIPVLDSFQDDDVDEIQTVPRTRGGLAESIGDDREMPEYASSLGAEPIMEPVLDAITPEEPPVPSPRRKGLGYFDLHPERKRAIHHTDDDDDDPRTRLAYMDSDDEGGNEEDVLTTSEPQVSLQPVAPLRPLPKVPPVKVITPSGSPALSPVIPKSVGPDISFDQAEEQVRAPRDQSPSRIDSATLPVPSPRDGLANGNGHTNGHVNGAQSNKAPSTPSKTATLIEMYRERERSVSPKPLPPTNPVPPQIQTPPRLTVPTRASSLPVTPPLAPASTSLPSPPQQISIPPHVPPIEVTYEPPLVTDNAGRASPARYVHGAPLHNVLEEDEEDETF